MIFITVVTKKPLRSIRVLVPNTFVYACRYLSAAHTYVPTARAKAGRLLGVIQDDMHEVHGNEKTPFF